MGELEWGGNGPCSAPKQAWRARIAQRGVTQGRGPTGHSDSLALVIWRHVDVGRHADAGRHIDVGRHIAHDCHVAVGGFGHGSVLSLVVLWVGVFAFRVLG